MLLLKQTLPIASPATQSSRTLGSLTVSSNTASINTAASTKTFSKTIPVTHYPRSLPVVSFASNYNTHNTKTISAQSPTSIVEPLVATKTRSSNALALPASTVNHQAEANQASSQANILTRAINKVTETISQIFSSFLASLGSLPSQIGELAARTTHDAINHIQEQAA